MIHLPIGIDLGTSTSEIAVFQHGEAVVINDPLTKNPILPSNIAVNNNGRLLVGEEARDFVDLPGHGVREIKRQMGSGEVVILGDQFYRPEELSAVILRKLKHNAEVMLGDTITDIVLSVPANFPDTARQATLLAAELAGLRVVRLINEPTAAALAFGVNHLDVEAQIVVFDFGGGTLDVSVLEMVEGVLDVRCSFGDPQLGGKDFDEALTTLIVQRFQAQYGELPISDLSRGALKSIAMRAKITLSDSETADIYLPGFALRDGTPVDLALTITREDFETAIAPLLQRARAVLLQALAAGNIRSTAIDRVLLVGGTTYIPSVRQLVYAVFGIEPAAEVDPDLAVALGATILAAMEAGVLSPEEGIILTDASPFGIGFEALDTETGLPIYVPLIKPNTPIPFTREYAFSLVHHRQDRVKFHLYQSYISEALPLVMAQQKQLLTDTGISGEIHDIPPSSTNTPHPVRVNFSYDENGLVIINASIPGLTHQVAISYQQTTSRMNPEEFQKAQQQLDMLFQELEQGMVAEDMLEEENGEENDARYWEPVIAKAERLTVTYPDHSDNLLSAITRLREALQQQHPDEIDNAGDALADLIDTLEG